MEKLDKSSLVVIDIQVDFCPGGALPVMGGDEIIPGINKLLDNSDSSKKLLFQKIVFTSDWHPSGHISFASSHKKTINKGKESVPLWPDHCIEGTPGAEFYPGLRFEKADLLIRKGRNPELDSYSAFYENDKKTPTGLAGYLKEHGIETVYLCGLALDWCIFFSAVDSIKLGFETYIIKDLTRAIDLPPGYALEKEQEILKLGGKIINSRYFKAGRQCVVEEERSDEERF